MNKILKYEWVNKYLVCRFSIAFLDFLNCIFNLGGHLGFLRSIFGSSLATRFFLQEQRFHPQINHRCWATSVPLSGYTPIFNLNNVFLLPKLLLSTICMILSLACSISRSFKNLNLSFACAGKLLLNCYYFHL